MENNNKTNGLSRRKVLVTATSALAASSVLSAPLYAVGKRKLRYIAFINRNTVWGKPYDFLADEVSRLSNGELEIEYAGGSDVIGGFDAPEAIANGVFDMSHSANSYFAGAVPASISLASGNASPDALKSSGVVDAYSQMVMKQRGVKVLGMPLTGVGYASKCEANRVSCLILREKIRSIPLYDPILESLGATPVTTSPAEAYAAMERGVVDGLGWPDIGLLDFKFYEQAKFVMLPDFYQLRTVTLINPGSFNGLPKELQKVLMEASASADAIGNKWAKEKRAAEHAEMEAAGVEFVSLSNAESSKFRDLTEEKLWSKITELAPTDSRRLKPLFDAAAKS